MIRLFLFFLFVESVVGKFVHVNVERRGRKNPPHGTREIAPSFSRTNQSLVNHDFLYYTGVIYVGSPPKRFVVNFDTGSDLLWLTTPSCRDKKGGGCVSQKQKYDLKQSTTGKNLSQQFVTGYADGSIARGWYMADIIRLSETDNSTDAPNFPFGAVDLQKGMNEDDNDGLFGLSFQINQQHETFVSWLKKNRALGEPVITIHMPKDGNSTGELVFGGRLGPNKCGPLITTVPANVMPPFWSFRIAKVSLDGAQIDSNSIGVSDSGTTLIVIGSSQFLAIQSKYPLYPKQTNCDGSQVRDLKLEFVIGDKTLTLTGPDLIYRSGAECSVGITSNGGGPVSWLLGDVFIRNFCNFLNYEQETIGFAVST